MNVKGITPGAFTAAASPGRVRTVILAWRQPSGTSADRDITVRRFIIATGFLSSATLGLAVYAPRHRLIDLQVVNASLAEVIAYLTAAIGAQLNTLSRTDRP